MVVLYVFVYVLACMLEIRRQGSCAVISAICCSRVVIRIGGEERNIDDWKERMQEETYRRIALTSADRLSLLPWLPSWVLHTGGYVLKVNLDGEV